MAREPIDGDSNRVQRSHIKRMASLAIKEKRIVGEAPPISFGPVDLTSVIFPYSDALVIRVTIANYELARVLVDLVNSVNVLFQKAFNCMQLEETQVEVARALFGFAGHTVHLVGQIILSLTLGDVSSRRISMTPFLMVDVPSTYNVILGCPFLLVFMVVASSYHQKIKFPIRRLVGEVWRDQKTTQEFYVDIVREDQKRARVEGIVVNASAAVGVHILEESTSRRSILEEGELVEIATRKATRIASEQAHSMPQEKFEYLHEGCPRPDKLTQH